MTIKQIILILSIFVSYNAFAGSRHKAHDHGHAALSIVSEGNSLSLELESPAESIVGFEHTAKTEKEKRAVAEAQAKIDRLVVLKPELGCTKEQGSLEIEQEKHSSHSDIEIKLSYKCQKPLAGSTVEIRLLNEFPKLKSVKTQVIGDKPRGLSITKASQAVDL